MSASSSSVTCTSGWIWRCETPTGGPISILDMACMMCASQGVRFTFSPEATGEALDRLLELNKERYEAEVDCRVAHTGQEDQRPRRAQPANQRLDVRRCHMIDTQ